MPNNNKSLNIFFDTLGCAKNQVDTLKMQELLYNNNFNIVEEADKSDIIVLNTCSFIEAAAQESIDTFFEYKNFYKNRKIVVAGCLPSRYKEDLYKSLKEADAFIPCDKEDKIVDVIKSFNIKPSNDNFEKFVNKKSPVAYVKISEGCNRFCSYCTIPYIRGRYKSFSYDNIYDDVKSAVEAGSKEIVLVAQDCGVWGSDLSDNQNLSVLLKKLASSFCDTNFRILYVQPQTINNELLHVIKENKNIINYLDVPLQHCNEKLLLSMNRKGNPVFFKELFNNIKNIIPDCTLRTTFIVGYPGEDDKAFKELCQFVQDMEFDYAGVFEYSKEEGTAAFKLKYHIEKNVKQSRSNTLRDICDNISIQKLSNKIGQKYRILIEGKEEERYFGRACFQAPDVDGVVYISQYSNCDNINIGQYLDVEIVDQEAYDLVGKII